MAKLCEDQVSTFCDTAKSRNADDDDDDDDDVL